jgi:hypothetical protein
VVLAEHPYPWALLRDRLEGELLWVAWAPPGTALPVHPWMLAGAGAVSPPPLSHLSLVEWVGTPPSLPIQPLVRTAWAELAADVERRLACRLAGLRLAPGCGLVLPDGAYLSGTGELEVLLAAAPDGLDVEPAAARDAARRLSGLIARRRLPLQVRRRGGHLDLAGLPRDAVAV